MHQNRKSERHLTVEARKVRSEQAIFDELLGVCTTPGFVHAIGNFCVRDNVVGYAGKLEPADYAKLFSPNRLIRTEISTLIGLMARADIDRKLPAADQLNELQTKAEALLHELHDTMTEPMKLAVKAMVASSGAARETASDGSSATSTDLVKPNGGAATLREPIFYGPDSAYSFQYRDLAEVKYKNDDDWLKTNKGFSISEAKQVVTAIGTIQDGKLLDWVRGLKDIPPNEWTVVPGFTMLPSEIATSTSLSIDIVRKVLDAFSFSNNGNPTFKGLSDFNATNAFPILKFEADEYIILQYVSLTEALYDTPFYWMGADSTYAPTALNNRGLFTERFAAERLEKVFGARHVFRNVDIWRSKDDKLCEIDTLVLFGGRAIALQAKSKKLTLEARKGNDLQLRNDFKLAILDSYDQGLLCSKQIASPSLRFTSSDGTELSIPKSVRKVHPICVISDHYPALSFQAHHFLKVETDEKISAPLICDVFALDTITELLETPLRLLSYLELRAIAGDSVVASHETTVLGFHLKRNLWLGEYDLIQLGDDISTDVDIAMMARRAGVEGEKVPPGILTHLRDQTIEQVITALEKRPDHPWPIEVGLELMKLSGETARDLSLAIDKIAADAAKDGRPHDITFSLGTASSGITVHCTDADTLVAAPKLKRHCELRKYSVKASRWHGIAVSPGDASLRFAMVADDPWMYNEALQTATRMMPKAQTPSAIRSIIRSLPSPPLGRNADCSCGSGRKFKKCCGSLLRGR